MKWKALGVALGLLLGAGCGPIPPPVPTPQHPPEPWHQYVSVVNAETGAVITGSILAALHTDDDVLVECEEREPGRVDCPLPPDQLKGHGGLLSIHVPDYQIYSQRFVVNGGERPEDVIQAFLLPFHVRLPNLLTRGQFFQQDTGDKFTAIEASDFNLLARWLDGADIRPILEQRRDVGFNLLRVWTRMDLAQFSIGRLVPSEHPDLYEKIPAFLDLCATYGLYVEFTAYSGRDIPGEPFDFGHWDRLIDAVADRPVLLELMNENDQGGNHIDETLFRRPSKANILASHGSNGSQQMPVRPAWDYETFHTNDAPEWPRKVGHNAMEWGSLPVLANENTRAPDHFTSGTAAFDAAAGAALLAAGSCFHSVSGKNSTLWSGMELALAQAWAAGAKSVPLACQDGPYVHRIDLETPDMLRVYERPVRPFDCVVRIRR